MSLSAARHVWEERNAYRIPVWKPQEKDLLGELGLDGRVTVEWILEYLNRRALTALMWLRIAARNTVVD